MPNKTCHTHITWTYFAEYPSLSIFLFSLHQIIKFNEIKAIQNFIVPLKSIHFAVASDVKMMMLLYDYVLSKCKICMDYCTSQKYRKTKKSGKSHEECKRIIHSKVCVFHLECVQRELSIYRVWVFWVKSQSRFCKSLKRCRIYFIFLCGCQNYRDSVYISIFDYLSIINWSLKRLP